MKILDLSLLAVMAIVLGCIEEVDAEPIVAEERTWYFSENISKNDFFEYSVCHMEYKNCLPFEVKMTVIETNQTSLLINLEIIDEGKYDHTILDIDTKEWIISHESQSLESFVEIIKESIFGLSTTVNFENMKSFEEIWFKTSQIGGMSVIPQSFKNIEIDGVNFNTALLSWSVSSPGKILIADDFPFPINGQMSFQPLDGNLIKIYDFKLLTTIPTIDKLSEIYIEKDDAEEIEFVSVWLKQPILKIDTSNFSEDNKAVDFTISFKTPTAGGWSGGMYCSMKTASDEAEKNNKLKRDRQIGIKLISINNKSETILAKDFTTSSNGTIGFTLVEPSFDSIYLTITPEKLDGVKCIEGQFKNIYGDHLIIQGSLEYDGFEFGQEYKLITWAGELTDDEVIFILPSEEQIRLEAEELEKQAELDRIEESEKQIDIEKQIETERIQKMKDEQMELERIAEVKRLEEIELEKQAELDRIELEKTELEKMMVPEPVEEIVDVPPTPPEKSEPKEEKGFMDWLMSLFGF